MRNHTRTVIINAIEEIHRHNPSSPLLSSLTLNNEERMVDIILQTYEFCQRWEREDGTKDLLLLITELIDIIKEKKKGD